jgi:preprotein translocase subunit SecB
MSQGRPTKGFKIISIYMVQSVFEWLPNAPEVFDDLSVVSKNIKIDIATKEGRSIMPAQFSHMLLVTLTGRIDDKDAWKAMSAFAGNFEFLSGEAELSMEQARQSASAILYGFAREHLADLLRRAHFPPFVLSPIMNFSGASGEAAQSQT